VNIGLVKLVYFSPTRTTESILRSIAAGLAVEPSGVIDFTLPEARAQSTAAFQGELVLLGVPVYAGRVPTALRDRPRHVGRAVHPMRPVRSGVSVRRHR